MFRKPSSLRPSQSLSAPSQISAAAKPTSALQITLPPSSAQTWTPVREHWPWPTSQTRPMPMNPSSVLPLQLSSIALHRSTTGAPATASQTTAALSALQTRTPARLQAPVPVEQAVFKPTKPSSVEPLQLLSRRSQISTPGASATALQTAEAPSALHKMMPVRRHSPRPAWQGRSRLGNVSSIRPSQLSSMPLHTSGTGSPARALHTTSAPSSLQVVTPGRRQAPSPETQGSMRPSKSSSVVPSQSLSRLSQSSSAASSATASQVAWRPSAEQRITPKSRQAPRPAWHGSARSGKSSSVVRSQSSSRPLQSSAIGNAARALHSTAWPLGEQVTMPTRWQAPCPWVQMVSRPTKVSSTAPSQSLSRPSQRSSFGSLRGALHSTATPSPEHTLMPARVQSPWPWLHGVLSPS